MLTCLPGGNRRRRHDRRSSQRLPRHSFPAGEAEHRSLQPVLEGFAGHRVPAPLDRIVHPDGLGRTAGIRKVLLRQIAITNYVNPF
jgi:hypothetical protein